MSKRRMSNETLAEARQFIGAFQADSPLTIVVLFRELLAEVDRLRAGGSR